MTTPLGGAGSLRQPLATKEAGMSQIKFPALAALVALLVALGVSSAGAAGAHRAQTLRFFSKPVSITVTTADGTVIRKPPYPEPKPGDVLDVNSLDFVGDHSHHAKRWSISDHVRCEFGTGAPDCESQVAIGGSLLVFHGNPGTVVNGTGRYQGATGRVLKNKEVKGGSDVVARIQLAP
jgi:hypothetical protein